MKAMIPLIAVQLGKGSMDEVSTRVSVLLIVLCDFAHSWLDYGPILQEKSNSLFTFGSYLD